MSIFGPGDGTNRPRSVHSLKRKPEDNTIEESALKRSKKDEKRRLGFEECYRDTLFETKVDFGTQGWYTSESYFKVNENEKSRRMVDFRTQGWYTFGDHASEFGWNLPRDHPRHILNFPAELLAKIMSFILVAPVPITPLTVTCNWMGGSRSQVQEPCYRINDSDQPELPCGRGTTDDRRRILYFRAPIDATLLRVNRFFLEKGRELLYGKNTFEFDLNSRAYAWEGKVNTMDSDGQGRCRENEMPRSEELQGDEVRNEIRDMINKARIEDLPEWIYCDPFARFLHFIGPANASHIRRFRITGPLAPSHQYERNEIRKYGATYLNLSYYLKAYSHFLERYCQNLEILEIHITGIAISYWTWLDPYGIDIFEDKYRDPGNPGRDSFPEDEDDATLEYELYAYEEVQYGDAVLEANLKKNSVPAAGDGKHPLYELRKFREEMLYTKKAELLLRRQNRVVLPMKPLLESLCPKLKNLRLLEVKRPLPKLWTEYQPKYHEKTFLRHSTWKTSIPVDFVKCIQSKIDIASLKRWQWCQEMEKVEDKMKKLRLEQEKEETNESKGEASQLNPNTLALTPNASSNQTWGGESRDGLGGWNQANRGYRGGRGRVGGGGGQGVVGGGGGRGINWTPRGGWAWSGEFKKDW